MKSLKIALLMCPVVLLLLFWPAFALPTAEVPAATDDDAKAELMAEMPVQILIVTNEDLSESWGDFADWKTRTGRVTKVVTTESIADEFEGEDLQQKIRQCCLKHIDERGTEFVILGGDSAGKKGIVPDRDTDHSDFEMLPYANIPTDIYYISEKDWDANDDGVYGKFEDDLEAIEYTNPKASIGRIPVRTADDVEAYTEKMIAYESKYPVGRFAHRMVYTCPEKSAYPKLKTSFETLCENWSDGDVSRFFGNTTPWDDQKKGDYDLTAENWTKLINDRGAAKMHMHGHGILPRWILENRSSVDHSIVSKLDNKNAYPIITTVSCLTGQFDDREDPSIAESMLRKRGGGAIAVLAPSRQGIPVMMDPPNDYRLMMTQGKMDGTTDSYTRFWVNAMTGSKTIGEAFRKVKVEMTDNARKNQGFHMIQCELNLLGDPTLDPRPQAPQNFEDGSVRVRDGKIFAGGFKGAKVCVSNGKDFYRIVDANRKYTPIDLEEHTGTFSVAAFAPGFNIWFQKEVKVAPPKKVDKKEDDKKEDDE